MLTFVPPTPPHRVDASSGHAGHMGYGTTAQHHSGSMDGDEDLQAQTIAEFADYQRLRQVQLRIMGLCWVCMAVFCVRAVVALLIATQAIPNNAGYPLRPTDNGSVINRYVYDSVRTSYSPEPVNAKKTMR